MSNAINRREFIAAGATTAVVASASPLMHAAPARASGMSFIHLFLPGGWPCNDLWDPKPYSPFRVGMRGSELTSTTQSIATAASAISISSLLYHTAHAMDRATIVRSLTDNDTDHATAQRRMLDALTFGAPADDIPIDRTVTYGLSQALLEATRRTANGASSLRVRLPFEGFKGFDAHEFGGQRVVEAARQIDMVIAAIVHQLEGTGQLDRTIFCISSEFNRTIAGRPAPGSDLNTGENLVINDERDYGFHAHFAEANSIVLFGGPFKRGFVYGKTGPRHPMRVVENPVTLADMHATIAVALGETPREGRVITELFA